VVEAHAGNCKRHKEGKMIELGFYMFSTHEGIELAKLQLNKDGHLSPVLSNNQLFIPELVNPNLRKLVCVTCKKVFR
jgi:hypothetical protein